MASSKKIANSTLPLIAEITLTETAPSTALTIIPTGEADQETPPEAVIEEIERATLSTLTIHGARITPQSIIHPNLWGRERWFAKSRLHSYSSKREDGSISIILPTSELTYRDSVLTETQAVIAPYTGEYTLPNIGGAHSKLNRGYEGTE